MNLARHSSFPALQYEWPLHRWSPCLLSVRAVKQLVLYRNSNSNKVLSVALEIFIGYRLLSWLIKFIQASRRSASLCACSVSQTNHVRFPCPCRPLFLSAAAASLVVHTRLASIERVPLGLRERTAVPNWLVGGQRWWGVQRARPYGNKSLSPCTSHGLDRPTIQRHVRKISFLH